jgi:hypothetical protein
MTMTTALPQAAAAQEPECLSTNIKKAIQRKKRNVTPVLSGHKALQYSARDATGQRNHNWFVKQKDGMSAMPCDNINISLRGFIFYRFIRDNYEQTYNLANGYACTIGFM